MERNYIRKNKNFVIPLVYEIISRNGKNVKGNKVDVDWKISEPKPEPKGFDKKPKSVSVQTAIKNVLTLKKFKNEKQGKLVKLHTNITLTAILKKKLNLPKKSLKF